MQTAENLKLIKEKNKINIFVWLFLLFELAVFFAFFFLYLLPEIPEKTLQSDNDFNTILLYLSYISVIAVVPLAYKIYDTKKKQAGKLNSIKQIADKYFLTMIIIYSLFEFAAVMTLIAFYVNEMYEPLYMFGIIYVAVLLHKPSLKRFMQMIMKEDDKHAIITENETGKTVNPDETFTTESDLTDS